MKAYFHGYFGLSAIAGIEIALWDIIAKKANRPLCDMIGGMYRKEVPFSGYIFFRLKDEEAEIPELDLQHRIMAIYPEPLWQQADSTDTE
jgi:L-alanine-DL-glutamate epimerase-like enolase superfamily enzyme